MLRGFLCLAAALWVLGPGGASAAAQDRPIRLTAEEARPFTGRMTCPVGQVEHREYAHAVRYRGRLFYMCSEDAVRAFLADPEKYARNVEPVAGLFRVPDPSRSASGGAIFWLGIYVVLALVCGALAAYAAVQKGLDPTRWFVAGCLLNLVGVGLAWSRPGRELPFARAGLAKMPTTHDPWPCPQCGKANHPAASRCPGCGTSLSPRVTSEVERVGQGEG